MKTKDRTKTATDPPSHLSPSLAWRLIAKKRHRRQGRDSGRWVVAKGERSLSCNLKVLHGCYWRTCSSISLRREHKKRCCSFTTNMFLSPSTDPFPYLGRDLCYTARRKGKGHGRDGEMMGRVMGLFGRRHLSFFLQATKERKESSPSSTPFTRPIMFFPFSKRQVW